MPADLIWHSPSSLLNGSGSDGVALHVSMAGVRAESAETREATCEELVLRGLPLARHCALLFCRRPGERDDLEAVAYLGLCKAAQRYDPNHPRSASFETYAYQTVRGELLHYLEDRSWFVRPPREVKRRRSSIQEARDAHYKKYGIDPRPEDLAEKLHISVEDLLEALELDRCYSPKPLLAKNGFTPRARRRRNGSTREVDDRLDCSALLGRLTSRRCRVAVRMYYLRELDQPQIARRLGCSQATVSRLIARGIKELRSLWSSQSNH